MNSHPKRWDQMRVWAQDIDPEGLSTTGAQVSGDTERHGVRGWFTVIYIPCELGDETEIYNHAVFNNANKDYRGKKISGEIIGKDLSRLKNWWNNKYPNSHFGNRWRDIDIMPWQIPTWDYLIDSDDECIVRTSANPSIEYDLYQTFPFENGMTIFIGTPKALKNATDVCPALCWSGETTAAPSTSSSSTPEPKTTLETPMSDSDSAFAFLTTIVDGSPAIQAVIEGGDQALSYEAARTLVSKIMEKSGDKLAWMNILPEEIRIFVVCGMLAEVTRLDRNFFKLSQSACATINRRSTAGATQASARYFAPLLPRSAGP